MKACFNQPSRTSNYGNGVCFSLNVLFDVSVTSYESVNSFPDTEAQ